MIASELQNLMDNTVENAGFLLKKTQCRQAYVNLKAVTGMKKMILVQDKAEDKLLDMCAEAAQKCRDYIAIIEAAEAYVSPKAWKKILDKAGRKYSCVYKGGDIQ